MTATATRPPAHLHGQGEYARLLRTRSRAAWGSLSAHRGRGGGMHARSFTGRPRAAARPRVGYSDYSLVGAAGWCLRRKSALLHGLAWPYDKPSSAEPVLVKGHKHERDRESRHVSNRHVINAFETALQPRSGRVQSGASQHAATFARHSRAASHTAVTRYSVRHVRRLRNDSRAACSMQRCSISAATCNGAKPQPTRDRSRQQRQHAGQGGDRRCSC
jgi:hypothetical protein